MKAPWFPFYTGDFLASPDVQLMEAHEVGAYMLLLAHSWQSDAPGYLPNDEGRLRRAARLSADQWKESRDLVLGKWPVDEADPTLRVNPRLKKEADKQVEIREQKAEAGRKSAERRARLATEGQQKANINPTGVDVNPTDVAQNANYSQPHPQSQATSVADNPSSSLCSEDGSVSQGREGEQSSALTDAAPPPNEAPPVARAPLKRRSPAPQYRKFADTPYADRTAFKEAFAGTEYETADLDHYHEVIGNWAASKGDKAKYADWPAMIRNWLIKARDEGKLKLRPDLQPLQPPSNAQRHVNQPNQNGAKPTGSGAGFARILAERRAGINGQTHQSVGGTVHIGPTGGVNAGQS